MSVSHIVRGIECVYVFSIMHRVNTSSMLCDFVDLSPSMFVDCVYILVD